MEDACKPQQLLVGTKIEWKYGSTWWYDGSPMSEKKTSARSRLFMTGVCHSGMKCLMFVKC